MRAISVDAIRVDGAAKLVFESLLVVLSVVFFNEIQ